jgi:hypothetical protein
LFSVPFIAGRKSARMGIHWRLPPITLEIENESLKETVAMFKRLSTHWIPPQIREKIVRIRKVHRETDSSTLAAYMLDIFQQKKSYLRHELETCDGLIGFLKPRVAALLEARVDQYPNLYDRRVVDEDIQLIEILAELAARDPENPPPAQGVGRLGEWLTPIAAQDPSASAPRHGRPLLHRPLTSLAV